MTLADNLRARAIGASSRRDRGNRLTSTRSGSTVARRSRQAFGLALAVLTAISATLVDARSASATHAPPPITEFRIPGAATNVADSNPTGITRGPDGNLWFVEMYGNRIGRITPTGAMTFWTIPTPESRPADITAGPDGALWFTETEPGTIGRITTSGAITEYRLPHGTEPAGAGPYGITAGPDGNVWYADQYRDLIGRITPAGVITEYPLPPLLTTPPTCKCPLKITAGPDGNLWFTEQLVDQIGRITPEGVITEFAVPTVDGHPDDITAGPDGNVWFTERYGEHIGRITPAGVITEFPVDRNPALLSGITTGPDGNIWYTDEAGAEDRIGVMTPSGAVTSYAVPTSQSNPHGITAGPDGNMWFTEFDGDAIGRAVVDHAPPVVRAPTHGPALNWATGTSTVPMRVGWSATDAKSGVARYELQLRTDGGSYTAVSLPSATSTSIVRHLAPSHAYQFRVRALDGAGNWSAWSYGSAFALTAVHEAASSIAYSGTWTRQASSTAYGGYVKYATAAGASAKFTFTGRQVAWVAPRSATRGQAKVYVDGVYVTTVDLYTASGEPRRIVFSRSWSTSGTHTLEIRVVGTSGRPRVDIDTFVVTR